MNNAVEMTQLFKALSDPTRLRIVRLIAANEQQICVCELVDCLEEAQYSISRHLKELRECGVLTAERDGRWMYYSLSESGPVKSLGKFVADLPAEPFADDQRNFEARMSLRECGRCRIGIQKEHLSEAPAIAGSVS